MANEVSAILNGVRISPQKARLVANLIRGKKVDNALNILNFSPKKGAEIIKRVVESAIANAENNNGADIDELKIKYKGILNIYCISAAKKLGTQQLMREIGTYMESFDEQE